MEVILLQDVKALGKKGELVNINDGYARNYILPKKLGIEATNQNKNDLKLKKANDEKLAKEALADAKALAEKLKELSVTVSVKTGEGGKIFGTISTKEIAKAIKEQLDMDIDKKKMSLDVPIKAVGTYNLSIKLHKDVVGQLTVKVAGKE